MKVFACTSWNDVSQTCDVQSWVEQPTLLPPLSVADGQLLAAKIIGVWAIAFGLRMVARFIWRG